MRNPLESLALMLKERKSRLQEALLGVQEFDVMAENLSHKIDLHLEKIDTFEELSVDWTELKKQLAEQKVN